LILSTWNVIGEIFPNTGASFGQEIAGSVKIKEKLHFTNCFIFKVVEFI